MKTAFLKTGILTLVCIIFTSCGSDDKPSKAVTDDTFLTAKVDGVAFEVKGSLFAVETNVGGIKSTQMGANYEDDSKSITMGVSNLTRTGTYSLIDAATDDPLTATYASSIIYGEGDTGWYAIHFLNNVTATITITALDDGYLEGTFSFNGFDINTDTEKSITDGRFKFKKLKIK